MRPDSSEYKSLRKALDDGHNFRVEALRSFHRIEQTLGKVLDCPWYKDDKKNFSDATEADGVCIGDHTAETIVIEAAEKIVDLKEKLRLAEEEIESLKYELRNECDEGFEEDFGDDWGM